MRRAFLGVSTLEELKKVYKELALKYHPDRGGDVEIMKEVNALYDEFFIRLKNTHKNKDGEYYQKETKEQSAEFKDIIDKLIKMKGIEIEIIGKFIWVGGDTKLHRKALKELNFRWHRAKQLWYKAPDGYRKRGNEQYSMNEIRDMYGSSGIFKGEEDKEKEVYTVKSRSVKLLQKGNVINMKAVIVKPMGEPIVKDIPDTIEAMQEIVGGLIEVYPLSEDVVIICNDECKINGEPLNRTIYKDGEIIEIIAGTFFICSAPMDSENFEGLSTEDVEKYVEKFKSPEIFYMTGEGVKVIKER